MAKKITVAEYLSAQIQICGKSQKQIAAEVGFPKANVLTMMKHGSTRIPIHRVPALARLKLLVLRFQLLDVIVSDYIIHNSVITN